MLSQFGSNLQVGDLVLPPELTLLNRFLHKTEFNIYGNSWESQSVLFRRPDK